MLTLSEGPKPLGAVSAAGVVVYCTVAEGERVQSPLVFGAVSHPDKELTPPRQPRLVRGWGRRPCPPLSLKMSVEDSTFSLYPRPLLRPRGHDDPAGEGPV